MQDAAAEYPILQADSIFLSGLEQVLQDAMVDEQRCTLTVQAESPTSRVAIEGTKYRRG